jgi:hypothetical protein
LFYFRDSEVATFAMLLSALRAVHELVWLLQPAEIWRCWPKARRLLRRASARLSLLLPLLFVIGFAFYLMKIYSDRNGYTYAVRDTLSVHRLSNISTWTA